MVTQLGATTTAILATAVWIGPCRFPSADALYMWPALAIVETGRALLFAEERPFLAASAIRQVANPVFVAFRVFLDFKGAAFVLDAVHGSGICKRCRRS